MAFLFSKRSCALALLPIVMTLAACSRGSVSQSTPEVTVGTTLIVKTGKSFGRCNGYCIEEYTITQNSIRIEKKPNQPDPKFPTTTDSTETPRDLWDRIVKSVHFDKLQQMPETIGCPDCADGGAEWIEITNGKEHVKIVFEFGSTPPGMAMLLKTVRAVRERASQSAALNAVPLP